MTSITTEACGTYALLEAAGELDLLTTSDLRDALDSLPALSALIVDLSAVTFMDSTALGAFIGAFRAARERNAPVAVIVVREIVAKLFTTSGIDRLVAMTSNLDDAIEAVSPIGTR